MNRRAFSGLLACLFLSPPALADGVAEVVPRWVFVVDGDRVLVELHLTNTGPDLAALTVGGNVHLYEELFFDGRRHPLKNEGNTDRSRLDLPEGQEVLAGRYLLTPSGETLPAASWADTAPRIEGSASFATPGGQQVKLSVHEGPAESNVTARFEVTGRTAVVYVTNHGPDVNWVETGWGHPKLTLVVDGEPVPFEYQPQPRAIRTHWTALPVGEEVLVMRRTAAADLPPKDLSGSVALSLRTGSQTLELAGGR